MRVRLHRDLLGSLLGLGLLVTTASARAEVGSATLQIMAVIEESVAVEATPTPGGRAMHLKNLGNAQRTVNIRVLPPKTSAGPGPASTRTIRPALLTSGRELSEHGLTLPREAGNAPTVIEISAP